MLVGFSDQDLTDWKTNMHTYEKTKRTKKPFGRQFTPLASRITEAEVKSEQRSYDPILQKYSKPDREQGMRRKEEEARNTELIKHLKLTNRNPREYDIVNLHGSSVGGEKEKSFGVKAPIRNVYNPINNEKLPQFYFRNRDLKVAQSHNFKKLSPESRDFNIVTGKFHQNHEVKEAIENEQKDKKIIEKYNNTHHYDAVFGRYYDPSKQEEYDKNLSQSQLLHGSHFEDRLPPTYKKRQPLVLDREKPPSQSLIELDQKRINAKKRFQLKYILEDEYARRNIEFEDKKQAQLRNRVHNSHLLEMKAKQFDIVNMSGYEPSRAESMMGKEAVNSTWDRLASNSRGSRRVQSGIKSSGFS